MPEPDLYNMTETGELLGLTRQTVSEIVDRVGIETVPRGLPGRARWLTMANVRRIADILGIEVKEAISA